MGVYHMNILLAYHINLIEIKEYEHWGDYSIIYTFVYNIHLHSHGDYSYGDYNRVCPVVNKLPQNTELWGSRYKDQRIQEMYMNSKSRIHEYFRNEHTKYVFVYPKDYTYYSL